MYTKLENLLQVKTRQLEKQVMLNKKLDDWFNKSEIFKKASEKFIALEDRIVNLESIEARIAKLERLLNAG